MDDERPYGHSTLKLQALFVPDGNPDDISAADIVGAAGARAATFPAIYIPDGSDVARPGYPWIEFGRMTLPAPANRTVASSLAGGGRGNAGQQDPSPGLATKTASIADVVSGPLSRSAPVPPPMTARSSPAPRRSAPGGGPVDYGDPDIAATMKLWNSLSDPSALLDTTAAALDAKIGPRD